MSEVKIKTIQEAFPDYNGGADFLNCIIESINFFKNINKIEILLKSDIDINIEEIFYFKTYIKNKFNLEDVSVLIKENPNVGAGPCVRPDKNTEKLERKNNKKQNADSNLIFRQIK